MQTERVKYVQQDLIVQLGGEPPKHKPRKKVKPKQVKPLTGDEMYEMKERLGHNFKFFCKMYDGFKWTPILRYKYGKLFDKLRKMTFQQACAYFGISTSVFMQLYEYDLNFPMATHELIDFYTFMYGGVGNQVKALDALLVDLDNDIYLEALDPKECRKTLKLRPASLFGLWDKD